MMKKSDIYSQFSLATEKFDSPQRFGFDWFASALDKIWEAKWLQVNWYELETFSRDCLSSPHLTDAQKCELMREAWGAFTGRGSIEVKETV